MHRFFIPILFYLFALKLQAQQVATQGQPSSGALDTVARQWLGKPYIHYPLDKGNDREVLFRYDGFDCMTLVETALAGWLAQQQNSQAKEILTQLRYRDGLTTGYGSRLHYTTEWAQQACENGFLINCTPTLGGLSICKTVTFMSENPSLYPNPKMWQAIDTIRHSESLLSATGWHFLPSGHVSKIRHLIAPGDIIAFTSSLPNLDIAHIGIATTGPKGIHLLHASPKSKKVVVTRDSLPVYLKNQKQFTGIVVLRPVRKLAISE
jgi:hypothetical protein